MRRGERGPAPQGAVGLAAAFGRLSRIGDFSRAAPSPYGDAAAIRDSVTWEETMSNMRRASGASLAAAAALLLMAGCSTSDAPAQSAQVQCAGINACKGQSACKSASNSCKGLNACKGQG